MAADSVLEAPRTMGRKKDDRETSMIRVYEGFVESASQPASERRMTVVEFCERFLVPCVEKAHRDYIVSESKKLSGGDR